MYDTYGFPADLTADIARERSFEIDQAGFDAAMAEQRKRAQQASNFGTDYNEQLKLDDTTEFTGYEHIEGRGTITSLVVDGQTVESAGAGQEILVVLDNTPFYAESGGQIGDSGTLSVGDAIIDVKDTVKIGNAFGHQGTVSAGTIKVGDVASAQIDAERRQAIALNHSVTHLLHAVLRNEIGDHVTQKGSLVAAERLRFDFSHYEGVTREQLFNIERLVNEQIRLNNPVATQLMDLEAAKEAGAMALFGEKYDDQVRVVSMGELSTELCGGTHVKQTGDIGLFKIVSEAGIAAGVRRIEAVTGEAAIAHMQQMNANLDQAAAIVKGDSQSLVEKTSALLDRSKQLEKELAQLKAQLASQQGANLVDQAVDINGTKVLVAKLDGVDPKALRGSVDELKNKLGSGIIVLGVADGAKVSLVAGVTKDLTGKVKAGELVNMVAQQVGGKGGGRPDMAMAGGSDSQALPGALESVNGWLSERI